MDVVESNAHGHVLRRVEIEAAADTEKRFQVTPLPAGSKLLDDKREGRGIRLERGRLMHAADCWAHKEGHPSQLPEIELRAGRKRVGRRVERYLGIGTEQRQDGDELELQRRGEVLGPDGAVAREDA